MKYILILLLLTCCANNHGDNCFGEVPKYFHSANRTYKYEVLSCTKDNCKVKVIASNYKQEVIGEVFEMSKELIYESKRDK